MSIFVSYASKDRNYVDSFILEANKYKKIDLWVSYKEGIPIGKNVPDKIKKAIKDSEGAILLVSNNFLSSEFVVDDELPTIMKRVEEDSQYRVAPVLIEDCNFDSNLFLKDLQFVNSPSTSLSDVSLNKYSDIVKKTVNHFKFLNKRNPIMPILLGGIIVAFIFGSIASSNNISFDEPNNEAETIVGAIEEQEISNAEWTIMSELNNLPKKWNDEALIFVTAYMDQDVSWEEFLDIGWESYFNLLDIVTEGMRIYGGLETLEVEALYFPILDNYADKLVAIEKILIAVEEGDIDGEIKAGQELEEAASRGQDLACAMLEAFNSPEFSDYLTNQQKATLDLSLIGC